MIKTDLEANYQKPVIKILIIDTKCFICVSGGGENEGGGYGSRQLLWQDVSGRWATVSDRSVAAFAADAGLVFNLGSVSVLAGASTIGFRNITAEFGIGLRF